jgi:hypothetical protein
LTVIADGNVQVTVFAKSATWQNFAFYGRDCREVEL